ncbi:hypothetical protein KDH83_04925, partial [Achromobacter sp. Marseille-Q0513]|uniref:hypothetical protein n=1 Tax=Achromobacter sp. Marseille-Q0513 TaxID=2829161 RepID=UPI001B994DE3
RTPNDHKLGNAPDPRPILMRSPAEEMAQFSQSRRTKPNPPSSCDTSPRPIHELLLAYLNK